MADKLKSAFEQLAAANASGDKGKKASGLLAAAQAFLEVDAFSQALPAASDAASLFQDLKNKEGEAGAQLVCAKVYAEEGRPIDTLKTATDAWTTFRSLGKKKEEAAAQIAMATGHLLKHSYKEALQTAEDALAMAKDQKDKTAQGKAMYTIALVHLGKKDAKAALSSAKDALKVCEESGDTKTQGAVAGVIVRAHVAKDDSREALIEGEALLSKFKDGGVMLKMADVYLGEKDYDEAVRMAEKAAATYKDVGDKKGEATAKKMLGQAQLESKEPGSALTAATEASEIFQELKDTQGITDTLQLSVSAQLELNQSAGAQRDVSEIMLFFQDNNDKRGESGAMIIQADVYLATGEIEKGLKTLKEGADLAHDAQDVRREALAYYACGQVLAQIQSYMPALEAANEALSMYKLLGDKLEQAKCLDLCTDAHFGKCGQIMSGGAPPMGWSGSEPRDALRASKEALAIYRDLRARASEAATLHKIANCHLMLGDATPAWRASTESQSIYRAIGDQLGEAGATLLVAAAHLADSHFEDSGTSATKAAQLYREKGDRHGEYACEDFLEQLERYERGELNPKEFGGFIMRPGGGGEEPPPPREKGSGSKKSAASDGPKDYLTDMTIMGNNGMKFCNFNGFESRRARLRGGGSSPSKKDAGGMAKGQYDEDKIRRPGYNESALYEIRWQKTQAPGAAGAKKK